MLKIKKELLELKLKLLIDDPIKYVKYHYYNSFYMYRLNKILFILFNIITSLTAFALVVITTIIISNLVTNGYPSWYLYVTTFVSATISLGTSLFNFFYIKDNIQKYYNQNVFIKKEIIKYKNNYMEYETFKDKEFGLFKNIYGLITESNDLRSKNEK